MIVIGVLRQGLDCDEIARLDREHQLQRPAEIATMHGFGRGAKDVMADRRDSAVHFCLCHLVSPPDSQTTAPINPRHAATFS
jgi:hypothetical protein